MKKIIVAIFTVLVMCFAVNIVVPQGVYAAPDASCDKSFMGFRAWYNGIVTSRTVNNKKTCVVETPFTSTQDNPGGDVVSKTIWTIVLNVLFDLFVAVGYVAVGIFIYGGWLFLSSQGNPAILAKAKGTITSGVIGIAIAVLANLIVNLIFNILTAST